MTPSITTADTLTDVRRETREKQQRAYVGLISKTVTGGSLTHPELTALNELLGQLGFTPADVQRDEQTIRRHGELVKELKVAEGKEEMLTHVREQLTADLKPYWSGDRRTQLLAQLVEEENDLRRKLKEAERALAATASVRKAIVEIETDRGWLVTPPAAQKATARKGPPRG